MDLEGNVGYEAGVNAAKNPEGPATNLFITALNERKKLRVVWAINKAQRVPSTTLSATILEWWYQTRLKALQRYAYKLKLPVITRNRRENGAVYIV